MMIRNKSALLPLPAAWQPSPRRARGTATGPGSGGGRQAEAAGRPLSRYWTGALGSARQGPPGLAGASFCTGAPTRPLASIARRDYASVAAAFYMTWGSVEAVRVKSAAFSARCAPLVIGPLEGQLSTRRFAASGGVTLRLSRPDGRWLVSVDLSS